MAYAGRLLVFGASGHGKVVADAGRSSGLTPAGFLDEDESKDLSEFCNLPVLSWVRFRRELNLWRGCVVGLGVGDNGARERCYERVCAAGLEVGTIVHEEAVVAPSAFLGAGTVVMALAAVNPGARVGEGAILNTGSVVEHDNCLGRFVHLSPNSALGGHVTIGDRAHLGLGAVVLPGVRIGADVRVGAGAVVTRDVRDGFTVVGVPAKPVRWARAARGAGGR